tara:strand:- start:978 stop:1265 length:288 start_codon:yes stop_codon:yes gene_type:complete
MKHKINVTEEDIKKGTPNDCKSCAISQALKRKFKTDSLTVDLDVNGDVCIWVKNKEYEISDMHESDVADFIFDFDQVDGWSKVKPITFEMIERTE